MVFGRVRPVDFTEVEFRHGLRRPVTSSFPSGHATAAFCAATLLGGGAGWYALAAGRGRDPRLRPPAPRLRRGRGRRVRSRSRRRASAHGARAGHDGRRPGGPPDDATLRRELRLPVPLRPQRPRGRRGRIARGARLGRAVPRVLARPGARQRGRAARLGATPRRTGHRRARARVGHRGARRVPRPLPRRARRAFAARHDQGEKIAEESVLRAAIGSVGLDPDAVAAEVASGRPARDARRRAHRSGEAVRDVRRADVRRRRTRRVRRG